MVPLPAVQVFGERTFVCPRCGQPATGSIQGLAYTQDFAAEDFDSSSFATATEYALIQCGRCEQPLLMSREYSGDDLFGDEEGAFVYPGARELNPRIPAELREAWQEARTCLEAKAYMAAAVMVRRTLEGTVADQGHKKKILAQNLREMQAQGRIDGTLAEWADLLRVVGNQGAHFTGAKVSREHAEDALSFAEALLDHLYVLRQRFDDFKRRRDAKADPAGRGSE